MLLKYSECKKVNEIVLVLLKLIGDGDDTEIMEFLKSWFDDLKELNQSKDKKAIISDMKNTVGFFIRGYSKAVKDEVNQSIEKLI